MDVQRRNSKTRVVPVVPPHCQLPPTVRPVAPSQLRPPPRADHNNKEGRNATWLPPGSGFVERSSHTGSISSRNRTIEAARQSLSKARIVRRPVVESMILRCHDGRSLSQVALGGSTTGGQEPVMYSRRYQRAICPSVSASRPPSRTPLRPPSVISDRRQPLSSLENVSKPGVPNDIKVLREMRKKPPTIANSQSNPDCLNSSLSSEMDTVKRRSGEIASVTQSLKHRLSNGNIVQDRRRDNGRQTTLAPRTLSSLELRARQDSLRESLKRPVNKGVTQLGSGPRMKSAKTRLDDHNSRINSSSPTNATASPANSGDIGNHTITTSNRTPSGIVPDVQPSCMPVVPTGTGLEHTPVPISRKLKDLRENQPKRSGLAIGNALSLFRRILRQNNNNSNNNNNNNNCNSISNNNNSNGKTCHQNDTLPKDSAIEKPSARLQEGEPIMNRRSKTTLASPSRKTLVPMPHPPVMAKNTPVPAKPRPFHFTTQNKSMDPLRNQTDSNQRSETPARQLSSSKLPQKTHEVTHKRHQFPHRHDPMTVSNVGMYAVIEDEPLVKHSSKSKKSVELTTRNLGMHNSLWLSGDEMDCRVQNKRIHRWIEEMDTDSWRDDARVFSDDSSSFASTDVCLDSAVKVHNRPVRLADYGVEIGREILV